MSSVFFSNCFPWAPLLCDILIHNAFGSVGETGERMRQKRTITQEFFVVLDWFFWFSFFAAFILDFFVFFFLILLLAFTFLEEWKKIYFFNTEFHLSS